MIKAGMSVAEAILQLTRGFQKVMGRKPDGLEKIKIQQEAVERLKNLEKVVDMQGNVIDTSKGIIGGRQIQDNKEFGEALKKALMETDNPYSDLVKETKKGPKTLEQRRKEAEEALKNKNVKPIRESLEDFVDDAGGVNPDDPRGIDDFIPDPDKKADGGRAGFAMGLGPRFIKFLNETNPIQAYKKYIQSVKKRAQEGDMKSLAPELGAVSATGVFINRRMKDVLENMKNQQMENNLENFKKELDADPFYKEYPEIKDKVLENYVETMFGEKKAQGGRAGFSKGKIVKEGLAKLAQLFKKEKPKGDKIYTVGGEEIDVADLKKSLGLDEATQKKDMENLEKKLQMIIGRDRTKHAIGGRAGFANGSEGIMSLDEGAPSILLRPRASGMMSEQQIAPGVNLSSRDINYGISGILQGDKFYGGASLDKGKVKFDVETEDGQTLFKDTIAKDDALNFIVGMGDPKGEKDKFQIKFDDDLENMSLILKKSFAEGGRANFEKGGMSRRQFMKIMGGVASLPFIGKYIKPAMPLIQKGAEITGPALDKIVQTVMSAGKLISQSGRRVKEMVTKKKLKDIEVEEDIMDGPSYTIKTKDKTIYYKPGRQDEMGIDDDIIEVIEDTVTKKAGGGIARMLGE